MANLSEVQVKTLLKKYRIPLVKELQAKTKEDAVKAADKIGYPVVLKVVSKDISHKTEFGGVEVNLKNKQDVEDAFEGICRSVKRHGKSLQGVAIQQMGTGYEVIIGGKTDSQFGPTIMFGLGGIWVEVIEDVSFRICPLTKDDAIEMIKETKGYKVLKGFRGKPAGDLDALAETIFKCSKMMMESKLQEFDINPLFVQQKGVLGVDFRMSK